MPNGTVFLSGEYRKWNAGRRIGVPKTCRRVLIKGLSLAFYDPKRTQIQVWLDGTLITGYTVDRDRLYFRERLLDGNYTLQISIKYSDLEGPVYS